MGDMSDETIELMLDLVEKHGIPRGAYERRVKDGPKIPVKPTELALYGGEPLLAFDRIERLFDRIARRGMKVGVSGLSNGTTGTLEQKNFLGYHNCWMQRSIDGHKEAQEKYRPGSWDKYIEKNEIWKDYWHSRRCTIQPEFAKDLLKSQLAFEEMGFWRGTSPMPNYYTEWSDEHIEDFKKSLWDVAKHYVKRWHENKAFYNYYFCHEISARYLNQRKFGCGFARGLHAVSWDGYLYTCHRFSKTPKDSMWCYGHLKDVLNGTARGYGEEVLALAERYRTNKREDWNEECRTCPGNAGCEKGCAHSNYYTTGSMSKMPKLYCEIRKETAKIVTWLDEQLRPFEAEWWRRGNTVRLGVNCIADCSCNNNR
jgi:radical SAM protein with 4Fe4S-binding SPASM domain